MKRFMKIITHLPFITAHGEKPATVMVESNISGEVIIKFPEGSTHGKELHKLLCNGQVDSFHMSVMDFGEVTYDPKDQILATYVCNDHKPVQHRDGKEPWCKTCKMTGDYREPRALRIGDSISRSGENPNGGVPMTDHRGSLLS